MLGALGSCAVGITPYNWKDPVQPEEPNGCPAVTGSAVVPADGPAHAVAVMRPITDEPEECASMRRAKAPSRASSPAPLAAARAAPCTLFRVAGGRTSGRVDRYALRRRRAVSARGPTAIFLNLDSGCPALPSSAWRCCEPRRFLARRKTRCRYRPEGASTAHRKPETALESPRSR